MLSSKNKTKKTQTGTYKRTQIKRKVRHKQMNRKKKRAVNDKLE